jgi:hypothetical protein
VVNRFHSVPQETLDIIYEFALRHLRTARYRSAGSLNCSATDTSLVFVHAQNNSHAVNSNPGYATAKCCRKSILVNVFPLQMA